MPRNEFARAYLNRWVASMGEPLVGAEAWGELAVPDARRQLPLGNQAIAEFSFS